MIKMVGFPIHFHIYFPIHFSIFFPFQAKVHADLPGFESLQILGCLGRSAEAACAHLGERRLGLAAVHATKALQVTCIQRANRESWELSIKVVYLITI